MTNLVASAVHVAEPVCLVDDVVEAHVALAAVVVQRHATRAVHYVLLVRVPGAGFNRIKMEISYKFGFSLIYLTPLQ